MKSSTPLFFYFYSIILVTFDNGHKQTGHIYVIYFFSSFSFLVKVKWPYYGVSNLKVEE